MKKLIYFVCIILVITSFGSLLTGLFNISPSSPETPSNSTTDNSNGSTGNSTASKPSENPDNKPTDDNSSVDYSSIVYSALGDSITWGQDGISNTRMEKTVVDVVGETLGMKKTFNLGLGWSTIAKLPSCTCHDTYTAGHSPMCDRYKNISIYSDIISIWGGVNDMSRTPLGDIDSYDVSTFYGAYNTLIKGVKDRYPSAWVFLITPTTSKKWHSGELKNDFGLTNMDYVNAVIALGEKWDLPVLEMHDNEAIKNELASSASDGVHPSKELVDTVIAPMIVEFIKDNYKLNN